MEDKPRFISAFEAYQKEVFMEIGLEWKTKYFYGQ